MKTCLQDLQVRYTEGIAKYIRLKKRYVLVVSICLWISHWTQYLDQLQWIIIVVFLQAAMLTVPKHCSLLIKCFLLLLVSRNT